MSWFRKKNDDPDGEIAALEAVLDNVDDEVEAADDERYKQMTRISADLKGRLNLLRRDAELIMRDEDK